MSSSKSSLSYLISRPEGGNVAVVAVGGAAESLDARPGALTLQVPATHTACMTMKLRIHCATTLRSKSNVDQLMRLKITSYSNEKTKYFDARTNSYSHILKRK